MTDDVKRLRLDGALTIKTAKETHDRLVSAFRGARASGKPLEIDVADDCDCDLTLPQLLLSARETAAREGVELRIRASAQSALLATLDRAGISAAVTGDSLLTMNGDQR